MIQHDLIDAISTSMSLAMLMEKTLLHREWSYVCVIEDEFLSNLSTIDLLHLLSAYQIT